MDSTNDHPVYMCGDCHKETKHFAIRVIFEDEGRGWAYKYGEYPAFGIPVPSGVLRMFGGDASLFKKGRQCENNGYGIAAFAYYRRVVESHRNDLFDQIIKVCETLEFSPELIGELKDAKKQISFSKSIDVIKTALPHGLLINGHNPLNALHGALSDGLHDKSDEACLELAQDVRVVLTALVDRIAMLKKDNRQLTDSVHRLIKAKK